MGIMDGSLFFSGQVYLADWFLCVQFNVELLIEGSLFSAAIPYNLSAST